jgi:ABC-type sugar transport system substrate-binding protein
VPPRARDPREVQLEIDAARESLAATLDQLAHRTSPKVVAAKGKSAALRFLQSPPGIAIVSGIGLIVTVGVVRKARYRKKAGKRRR